MIPAEFEILNRTYKVQVDPDIGEFGNDGLVNYKSGRVRIPQRTSVYSAQYQQEVFYHELAHIILEAMAVIIPDEVRESEDAVDLLGALLHQYHKTHKGQVKTGTKHES